MARQHEVSRALRVRHSGRAPGLPWDFQPPVPFPAPCPQFPLPSPQSPQPCFRAQELGGVKSKADERGLFFLGDFFNFGTPGFQEALKQMELVNADQRKLKLDKERVR